MDEVFARIRGQQRYLWRAVDQDGEVVDVLLQERRNSASARRFFRHLFARLGNEPRTIVTDTLGSHAVARRELLPSAAHDTGQYANNPAELSHRLTRVRERG
jgi:putative transposase